ncbi:MAG: delta-60 repeat domain-containing protein [Caldimonas sp.]
MTRFFGRMVRRCGVIAWLALAGAMPALAASGDLDTTFGTGGKVSVFLPGVAMNTSAMAKMADGRLLIVGGTGADSFIVRLNANGSLDTTWAGSGMLSIDFGGGTNEYLAGVEVQADGKVLVGGSLIRNTPTRFEAFIARFNADGTLDASFGTAGKSVSNFGTGSARATRLLLRTDGRPLVVGYHDTAPLAPFAFQTAADGSTDPAYGSGIRVALGSEALIVNAAALQSDGKLLLSAYNGSAPTSDFRIVRLNANGTPDAGFGSGGVASVDFGAYDAPTTLYVSPNGRIFAAGISVASGGSGPMAVACLQPASGALCSDFGSGGKIVLADPGLTNVVSILPSGLLTSGEPTRLLFAGSVPSVDGGDFFQFRLDGTTGARDTTFGSNGYIQTDLSGNADVAVAAVQGSLITAGHCKDTATGLDRVCVARFVDASVVPIVRFAAGSGSAERDFRDKDCERRDGCKTNLTTFNLVLTVATTDTVKVRVKSVDGSAKGVIFPETDGEYYIVDEEVLFTPGSTTSPVTLELTSYADEHPREHSADLTLSLQIVSADNALPGSPSELAVTVMDGRTLSTNPGGSVFGCTLGSSDTIDPVLPALLALAMLLARRRQARRRAPGPPRAPD